MALWVITGANRGIGLEFVRQLSRSKDNTVVACTRSLQSDLTDLSSLTNNVHKNVHIFECDTSSDQSIGAFGSALAKQIPDAEVKYVVNNAAVLAGMDRSSLSLDSEELVRHFRVNAVGPAKVTQTLLPRLAADGVVVNLSSGLGSFAYGRSGGPAYTYYSISKAALNMLTVQQADDLRGRATVVAMDPGWVRTRMGGPHAALTAEVSVKSMLEVIGRLKAKDSGKFLSYAGKEQPW